MLHEIDLTRADLNLLVLFDAVLRAGHVGRAAEQLSLSPSAVSHGLGRLRRMLNDPLFLRTPRGVVPTARALEISSPVADILARVRQVVATAEPFDAAISVRRFTIGAPDGVSAVFLPPLLSGLRRAAPTIDISVRQLLPTTTETSPERVWKAAFAELEGRAMDIAVIPSADVPARFHSRTLFEEDFVPAVRAGHPFTDEPSFDRYCELQHLVVSLTGDPYGFVDEVLAQQGKRRRVALTVPNFMFALAMLADSDLVCALPRRFVGLHGGRFDVVAVEPPMPLGRFRLNAVVQEVALMDAGVAWLLERLAQAMD